MLGGAERTRSVMFTGTGERTRSVIMSPTGTSRKRTASDNLVAPNFASKGHRSRSLNTGDLAGIDEEDDDLKSSVN